MLRLHKINKNLVKLLEKHWSKNGQMKKWEVYGVVFNLNKVLEQNLEGDVVELGCHRGTTSVYIKRILNLHNSNKEFHVYDSWEGLPEKLDADISEVPWSSRFSKGSLKVNKESFVNRFKSEKLEIPFIHSGWFGEISDKEYPEKICFAFLDGDFYSSILDSLNKIYHKVVPGGIIVIDDCGWNALPGCKKAVDDFMQDKKENLLLTGYPNSNYIFGSASLGGKIIKI